MGPLDDICNQLDAVSAGIMGSYANNAFIPQIYSASFNFPALNRIMLANMPKRLARIIREGGADQLNVEEVGYIKASLDNLLSVGTVSQMFNSNAPTAVPVFVSVMDSIRFMLNDITQPDWEVLTDSGSLPKKLTSRLRSIRTELDSIISDKEQLQHNVDLIKDATETAESLPADLARLKEARSQIDQIRTDVDQIKTDAAASLGKTNTLGQQAENAINTNQALANGLLDSLKKQGKEAADLVKQSKNAYLVATSTGLAAAFDERAQQSAKSVQSWVWWLFIALASSAGIGAYRIFTLNQLMAQAHPDWGVIWLNIILSAFGIGAPIWFAWLATKQISQRFRLSEDYAYKSSLAKAYEGYRREAARIDEIMEARLFDIALTQLNESPVRFLADDIHGSPWQELFASRAFQDLVMKVPEFKNEIIALIKAKFPSFNTDALTKLKAKAVETTTTEETQAE